MRRLFWLGVGAAVGVLVVRKASRAAQAFTPAGAGMSLSGAVDNLAEALRGFAADVRTGMAEREAELMAALHADGGELGHLAGTDDEST